MWVGLYPTVVLLTLALSPLQMPLWLGMLIGNLMSSFVDELRDDAVLREPAAEALAAAPARNVRGAYQLAGYRHRGRAVFWTVVFYLVTRVFWHLP